MNSFRILFLLLLGLSASACNQIRKGRQELSQRIRSAASQKQDQLFPRFDSQTPDTESNRKRFTEFLGIAPPPDVRQLYCHADELGADASYAFAFESNTATTRAIIKHLELLPDTTNAAFSGSLLIEQPWWNKAVTENVRPYSKLQGQVSWYLWRDDKTGKNYILTFDQ